MKQLKIMKLKQIVPRVKESVAFIALAGALLPLSTHAQTAPKPIGPVPNARQLEKRKIRLM